MCFVVILSSNLFAEDGDLETETDNESATVVYDDCKRDADCGANETCKDDGRCFVLQCETDADCRYDDLYCRMEDKQCALKICKYDADCLSYQLCISNECETDPTTYVEGGAGNCNSLSLTGHWDQVAMLVIGLLMLLFIRFRGNRE